MKRVVWYFEEGCVVIFEEVVWYFEEGCVVEFISTFKMFMCYFEDGLGKR